MCLAPAVKEMGFTALSKLSNFINPSSVPKALRPYTVHPDYISTCMYWLPKPANPGLPAVNAASYGRVLPDFGTFYFKSVTLFECAEQISNPDRYQKTQDNLLIALGEPDLKVVSIACGSMSALVTGPKEQMDRAAERAKDQYWCWFAYNKEVCTVHPRPTPAPPFVPGMFAPVFSLPLAAGPMSGPAPGPMGAPMGAPAPGPMLPVFAMPPPAPAPVLAAPAPVLAAPAPVLAAPAPAPVLAVAAAPVGGAAPGGAPGGAPAPAR